MVKYQEIGAFSAWCIWAVSLRELRFFNASYKTETFLKVSADSNSAV